MITRFREWIENLSLFQIAMLAIGVCVPAFLLNLGAMAFIGDEAIRTLVAFEMKLSGDLIVPTLNGIAYYNKPPLYNWLILLMSEAFGYFGEWPTRLTTLVFLSLYAWIVYYYSRKHFDALTAVTMAMMLLTSGRILFWDSMLGLIDICFSGVIFLNFMILYDLPRRQRWVAFFAVSYLLFSIGFLLKGLPAVVFQGISLPIALLLHGSWLRRLFSKEHLFGLGLGLLPLLAYYLVYANQVPLDKVFSVLLEQSLQRTATHHGMWETIKHLFSFPFEQIYHFLPWSLLIVAGFHPKARTWIREHDFIRFNFWMLVANLPVYWFSVQVYPRYLLMFIPLFHITGYYLLQRQLATDSLWWKAIQFIMAALLGIGLLGILGMPFAERVRDLDGIPLIWIGGALLLLTTIVGVLQDSGRIFLWFAIGLLGLRCVFDMVVLPLRKLESMEHMCREDCKRLAALYGEERWYIYRETQIHEVARFYTSAYTNQIIPRQIAGIDSMGYYMVDRALYPDFPGYQADSLILERGQKVGLMRPGLRKN